MSDSKQPLLRTPLYEKCVAAGGKMVDFHGWELPVRFEGIISEHHAVRNAAGMFDVSHMGQLLFKGPDAHKFLQHATSNNIKSDVNAGTYTHVLRPTAGVVDDVIAFTLDSDRFLAVVNSATTQKDFEWFISESKNFNVKIENVSRDYGMIALQGPQALKTAGKLAENITALPRFHIKEQELFGARCYITRTGYTGEDGIEVMAPPQAIGKIWDFFLESGATPCGLGARDVLRLEAGYLLYGADIDDDHTSYEADCGWVVKLNKGDFTGKAVLEKQKAEGVKRKLTSFQLTGPGVPRCGNKIYYKGDAVGEVTSGTFSPIFKGICKGYADVILAEGDAAEIESGPRRMPAAVVKSFYKNRV